MYTPKTTASITATTALFTLLAGCSGSSSNNTPANDAPAPITPANDALVNGDHLFTGTTNILDIDYNIVPASSLESGTNYLFTENTRITGIIPNDVDADVLGNLSIPNNQNGNDINLESTEITFFRDLSLINSSITAESVLGINLDGRLNEITARANGGIIQISGRFNENLTTLSTLSDFSNISVGEMAVEANSNSIGTSRFSSASGGTGANTEFTNLKFMRIENGSLSCSTHFNYTADNIDRLEIVDNGITREIPVEQASFTVADIQQYGATCYGPR